jgi:hypothetical protein
MGYSKTLKAVLSEISEDFAQLYVTDSTEDHLKFIWLSGIDRAPNVTVGDRGVLEYVATKSRGYWKFKRDV